MKKQAPQHPPCRSSSNTSIAGSIEVGYNSGAGGRKLAKSPFPYFDNKKAPKAEAFDAFWSVLTKKMQEQSLAPQGFAGF